MKLGPTPIRKVLVICEMLPVRSAKAPRYRGSTTRCQPGNILLADGKTRQWLAERYTPEAIRQGLAIFGTEHNKRRLRNKMAHRYWEISFLKFNLVTTDLQIIMAHSEGKFESD
jgi:hypothetical protein